MLLVERSNGRSGVVLEGERKERETIAESSQEHRNARKQRHAEGGVEEKEKDGEAIIIMVLLSGPL